MGKPTRVIKDILTYIKLILSDSFAVWGKGQKIAGFALTVVGTFALTIITNITGQIAELNPEVAHYAAEILMYLFLFLVLVVSPFRI